MAGALPDTPWVKGDGVGDLPNDGQLFKAIVGGDRESLRLLFEAYSPQVLALCQRILGNADDAEEVLLDVFLEIWEKAAHYNPSRGSVRIYLLQLARSRSIDRLRWNSVRSGPVTGAEEPAELTDFRHATPDLQSVSHEQAQAVREAVEALPPEQRRALEMVYFEGLTHRQIAERLGIPLGTAKTHIRQAALKLRFTLLPFRAGEDP